jgi:type I restriction enzyme M protein
MSKNEISIIQKVSNYCDVLQDDGIGYGAYTQQLTNILFLKMEDEFTKPPYNKKSIIPKQYSWDSLLSKKGSDLETHYKKILEHLGRKRDLLGLIFKKSENKITDPAKLSHLIKLINDEKWVGLPVDVKGEIYEGLLEKTADSSVKGAGQYFTPRALISAIIEVMQPKPNQTIGDPACGTGGFFLSAHEYINQNFNLDTDQKKFLMEKTFHGADITPDVTRLCAMNMFLHGIGTEKSQVKNIDSLNSDLGDRYDIVMTNPPFGKKSTVTAYSDEGMKKQTMSYERADFWDTTSNKQLNFVQHIKTILKPNGKCAVVIPDNVLLEGKAGETIRRKLLYLFDVHTMLRLPTGIFYAEGVKANVLFFDRKPVREGKPWTEKLWIYDFRTNIHFTRKENKMNREDLDDFVKCYNSKDRSQRKETERFKPYTYDEIINRKKASMDIFWIEKDSTVKRNNLATPEIISNEIKENLRCALTSIEDLITNIKND